jgi:hypothetical protein
MKQMIFHVDAAGDFRPVELAFATESEVPRLREWRKMTPASDAGEFAALAAKRWFYYSREGAAVASLEELRAALERNDRAELAFLMVASASWGACPGNEALIIGYEGFSGTLETRYLVTHSFFLEGATERPESRLRSSSRTVS